MNKETIMVTSNEEGALVQRIECAGCGKTIDVALTREVTGGEAGRRVCPNCDYDYQTDMFLKKEAQNEPS